MAIGTLWDYLHMNDCLKLSTVCSYIHQVLKQKMERHFTFRFLHMSSYPFSIIHFSSFSRIPFEERITTLSPQKAIVYSTSSIPTETTHLILIVSDPPLFLAPLDSFLPSILISLTLCNFDEPVAKLPPP
jgi:hypothetical protein